MNTLALAITEQRRFRVQQRQRREAYWLCRVMRLHAQGLTTKAIAEGLGVSRKTIYRLQADLGLEPNRGRM